MLRVLLIFALLTAACGGGDDDDDGPDAAAPDAALAIDAVPRTDAAPRPDAPPPTLGATCNRPFVLDTQPATHSADTTGFTNNSLGKCSNGSQLEADAFYRVPLGDTPVDLLATVTVDETVDAPFDVVLYGQTSCGAANTEISCGDSGWGERLELLDVSGEIFLVVDGTAQFGGATEGAYTLDTSTRAIVGDGATCDPAAVTDRCASAFRCAGGTCIADSADLGCSEAEDLTAALAGGPVVVTGTTHTYEGDFYQGSCTATPTADFPERLFRIDVSVASDLDASTDDPATSFDTYLYLRRAACDGTEVECHDDVDVTMFNLRSHLTATALEPDTYYLVLDGSSAAPGTGDYRLTVSLTPL